MTNATSKALQELLSKHSYSYLTTTLSAVAVALLILVLLERELIRASSAGDQRRYLTTFTVVLVPLMLVFVVVIVDRFMRLS